MSFLKVQELPQIFQKDPAICWPPENGDCNTEKHANEKLWAEYLAGSVLCLCGKMRQEISGYFQLLALTCYITLCIFFLGKQLTPFVLLYRVKMHPLDKLPFKLTFFLMRSHFSSAES